MGYLHLLFMALDAPEYAPDSEPKLSLLLSLPSGRLPFSASGSTMLFSGVTAPMVCTASLPLVLYGTFGGVGSPKDICVCPPVSLGTCLKDILSVVSLIPSVAAGVRNLLPPGDRSELY